MSQMITNFPLGRPADIPTYMGYLFALAKFGYHQVIPYWYSGQLVLFQHYAPGLFYFALPLYLLTNSVEFSMFMMIPILYTIIFFAIWIFGKKQNLSKMKTIAFFLILMANPFAIGNFVRMGRITELFGWTMVIILFLLMIHFLNHRLNKYFLIIFVPVYSILMIAHPALIMVFHLSFLPLAFFWLTSKKDKIMLAFAMGAGLLISSFWWTSFISAMLKQSSMLSQPFALEFIKFSNLSYIFTNVASLILSLALFILFYLYWNQQGRPMKQFWFFSPILIINFLVMTKLIIFLPLFKNIFPDIYNIFFIFFATLFFVKINFRKSSKIVKKSVKVGLILIPLIFVIISALFTPLFVKQGPIEKEVIGFLDQVEGKYVMLGGPSPTSHPTNYYVYGAIYHDLSTPEGSSTYGAVNKEYKEGLTIQPDVRSKDCTKILGSMQRLDVKSIIAYYEEDCNTLEICGLKRKVQGEYSCLYIKD